MATNDPLIHQRGSILCYPYYTPSPAELRTLLLFHDTVSTMVPHLDQHWASGRQHVAELMDRVPEIVRFIDPKDAADYLAFPPEVVEEFTTLVRKIVDTNPEQVDIGRRIQAAPEHHRRDSSIQEYPDWQFQAMQKIAWQIFDISRDAGLAADVQYYEGEDGQIIEGEAACIHRDLAEFIMARVSRAVGDEHKLKTVTFKETSFTNHLLDPTGALKRRKERADLYQVTLPLLIVDEIDRLPVQDFLAIRSEFSDVRRDINNFFQVFADRYELDSDADVETYLGELQTARGKINHEIETAARAIGEARFQERKNFLCRTAVSLVSSFLPGWAGVGTGLVSDRLFGGGDDKAHNPYEWGTQRLAKMQAAITSA